MEAALEGTSYSYGESGSAAWDTSAQVYEYAAETICEEFASGAKGDSTQGRKSRE